MKNLDVYKVNCETNEDDSLVFSIALVDEPANESLFITMAKDKKQIIKLSEEKRQITGVVLIPEQKIYRYSQEKGEFYMVFGADEIRKLAQKFYKNNFQRNSNINHSQLDIVKNLTFFESWIIEDPENDKANALGFKNLPKGTWMATAFVEDDRAWEMAKSGEVKGFSIEAFLDMEKVEMSLNKLNNKLNKKEKMSLLKKLITLFSADEEIKLKSFESDLGPLTVDALELDNIVYQEVEGEMVPLKDSVFVFECNVYRTDADGKIVDISEYVEEVPMEAEDEELPAEDVVMEEIAPIEELPAEDLIVSEIVEDVVDAVIEAPVEEEIDWKAVAEKVTKELESVLQMNKTLELKVEELSKQPATTKLKSNEVVVKGKESTLQALSRIVNANQNK